MQLNLTHLPHPVFIPPVLSYQILGKSQALILSNNTNTGRCLNIDEPLSGCPPSLACFSHAGRHILLYHAEAPRLKAN